MVIIGNQILIAQEKLSIQISGTTEEVAAKLSQNKDRISWYTLSDDKLASNVSVELANIGEKRYDRGRGSVKAEPDAPGKYSFNTQVDLDIKKVDKSKRVLLLVKLETILGNEVFYQHEMAFEELTKPILLDGYMWRAKNDKIKPERQLCLEFSSFISDAKLRNQYVENESTTKLNRDDFAVFLRQNESQDWVQLTERLEGSISNGNSIALANTLPTWIDPSKKLFVRFSAKTPLGNAIWGEYAVDPHEYRKEYRAKHYTSVAFDPSAAPNVPSVQTQSGNTTQPEPTQPEPVKTEQTKTEPVKTEQTKTEPVKTEQTKAEPVKTEQTKTEPAVKSDKATGVQVTQPAKVEPAPAASGPSFTKGKAVSNLPNANYDVLVHQADSLFDKSTFLPAKEKYEAALKLKPAESYLIERIKACEQKLQVIKGGKSF